MNDLAIHLYLIIRYINLSFNYFCNFYRIIVIVYISNNFYDLLITSGVAADSPRNA